MSSRGRSRSRRRRWRRAWRRFKRSRRSTVVLLIFAGLVTVFAIYVILRIPTGTEQAGSHRITHYTPPPAPAPRPFAVIVGDSYFGANGHTHAAPTADSVATRVGEAMRWEFDDSYVIGGTGFIAQGYTDDMPPYVDQVSEIVAEDPDIVLIEGGGNDTQYGGQRAGRAAEGMLRALRRRLPAASIILMGPLYSGHNPDGVPIAAALRDAAESVEDITYINPDGWIPGEFASTAGPGRQYVGPDRVHPTVAGVKLIVRKAVAALKKAGVPVGPSYN